VPASPAVLCRRLLPGAAPSFGSMVSTPPLDPNSHAYLFSASPLRAHHPLAPPARPHAGRLNQAACAAAGFGRRRRRQPPPHQRPLPPIHARPACSSAQRRAAAPALPRGSAWQPRTVRDPFVSSQAAHTPLKARARFSLQLCVASVRRARVRLGVSTPPPPVPNHPPTSGSPQQAAASTGWRRATNVPLPHASPLAGPRVIADAAALGLRPVVGTVCAPSLRAPAGARRRPARPACPAAHRCRPPAPFLRCRPGPAAAWPRGGITPRPI
jgi:hypothetical protein